MWLRLTARFRVIRGFLLRGLESEQQSKKSTENGPFCRREAQDFVRAGSLSPLLAPRAGVSRFGTTAVSRRGGRRVGSFDIAQRHPPSLARRVGMASCDSSIRLLLPIMIHVGCLHFESNFGSKSGMNGCIRGLVIVMLLAVSTGPAAAFQTSKKPAVSKAA